MMKKVLIIIAVLAATGLIAFTLANNKEEMKAQAKLAKKTSEYIPVELTQIEEKSVSAKFSASGTFKATSDLTLLSETQGQILELHKEAGDKVRKGELLAIVENEDIKAEVKAAESSHNKLQTDMERFSALADSNAVTRRQVEEVKTNLDNAGAQLERAKKRLEKTRIKASANGKINDDFIQEGSYITPGTKLFEIVDISRLKLSVNLTADQVLHVNEGDTVRVTCQVFPGRTFQGEVVSVASKADQALKYDIRIEVVNDDSRLKAGMYASAHFSYKPDKPGFYLKRNALIGSIQNPEVFVVNDSIAHRQKITIGQVYENEVQIINGLDKTQKVVLTGHINLQEGTQVKSIRTSNTTN